MNTAIEIIFEINSAVYPLAYSLEDREQVYKTMSEATSKLLSLFYKQNLNGPVYLSCMEEIPRLIDLSLLPDS